MCPSPCMVSQSLQSVPVAPPFTCTHFVLTCPPHRLSPTPSPQSLLPATPSQPNSLPPADSLTADWSFQVTSGLFPCLPNITGWLRPRNPAWERGGAEVHTHTNTHMQKKSQKRELQPRTHATQMVVTGAVLRSILSSIHFILWLSMVVCLCEDTYLPGMYLTERQVDINARKLHLYIQPLWK